MPTARSEENPDARGPGSAGTRAPGHQAAVAVEVGEDEGSSRATRWATADSSPAHSLSSMTSGHGSRCQGAAPALGIDGDVVGGSSFAHEAAEFGPAGQQAMGPSPAISVATCLPSAPDLAFGSEELVDRPGTGDVLGPCRPFGSEGGAVLEGIGGGLPWSRRQWHGHYATDQVTVAADWGCQPSKVGRK